MSTYVQITLREFEEFLEDFRDKTMHYFSVEQNPRSKEFIFKSERFVKEKNIFVRIFSSIDVRTHVGRTVGGDAIRVVVRVNDVGNNRNHNFTLWNGARVYRTENWRMNLERRLREAFEQVHKEPCPLCGAMLLLRNGANGPFYGCANYGKTKCRGTRNE